MFRNLGIVRESVSDTKLRVYNSVEKKEEIVIASRNYVSAIKAELNDEDGETIIVEYDLETKIVNENIGE